ncbi:FkbM family methyltransferase [Pelagibacteraceae bacterium]|nr:FkbM family methyltransferase [Pelagibacteraceae bacterium]
MIKFLLSKIIKIISKALIALKIHSRVVNQFNKLRSESHKNQDHSNLVSKLLEGRKLVALDVGAQGGFFNSNIFSKKYNFFFDPIVVEPIPDEAKKLEDKNYKVISKGLWSENCKKKLYILGKRPGSSSMYKPNPNALSLYDFKKKDFSIFAITNEIDIECTTIKESLSRFKVNNLDFLKIDTQGSELEILKGIGNYFPLLIKIEAQIIPMYENVPNWGELVNHLQKINYMTCEWIEIGKHVTRVPAEMDMIFIPNYLTEFGKKIIISREKEFISLMLIFGQIKLLQNISLKLNFAANSEIQKLKDKFFQ